MLLMTNWWLFFVPIECLSAKICYSWSSDKFAKRATCEFFSALFLLLVGSGPKRSMPIEKLGSSSLVSSIFQREGKLHCSLTGRKLWSQVKKKCSRHLIYARACVNKDFVHSGSIGLIYGKHARYVTNQICLQVFKCLHGLAPAYLLNKFSFFPLILCLQCQI